MLKNETQNKHLATNVVLATTFGRRLKGLSFSKKLSPDTVWIFPHCQIIHMFFMRFPLGLIFLDQKKAVIHIVKTINPWKISPYVKNAYYVIEACPEIMENIQIGETLAWENNPHSKP